MSKLYQPIKNNPYRLRDSVYTYVVWAIRSVGKDSIGYYDDAFMRQFKPSQKNIEAVRTALQEVPEEYREMVFNNVAFEVPWPSGYRNKVSSMKKAKFIYRVADLLGYELGAKKITYVEYDWR